MMNFLFNNIPDSYALDSTIRSTGFKRLKLN
uniref:Uncharacterized protein n=1 Tax=Arundo donax TaxID=35708 RepID=A0A0A9C8D7_ARUDO